MSESRLSSGTIVLEEATYDLKISLPQLVARCSVWANPVVVRRLLREDRHAAWYPGTRRLRRGETRGSLIDGIRLDDNSKANAAIKLATFGVYKHEGFHACHVWPGSCYDPRYHTSIANLTLVPAPLAGLTDFDATIAASLRRRSYELFGWHPEEHGEPEIPKGYPGPEAWRQPAAASDAVMAALNRRTRDLPPHVRSALTPPAAPA